MWFRGTCGGRRPRPLHRRPLRARLPDGAAPALDPDRDKASRAGLEHVDEGAEGRRHVAPPRIIQEQAWDGRTPRVEHTDELAISGAAQRSVRSAMPSPAAAACAIRRGWSSVSASGTCRSLSTPERRVAGCDGVFDPARTAGLLWGDPARGGESDRRRRPATPPPHRADGAPYGEGNPGITDGRDRPLGSPVQGGRRRLTGLGSQLPRTRRSEASIWPPQ